jgi:hypothetical protein
MRVFQPLAVSIFVLTTKELVAGKETVHSRHCGGTVRHVHLAVGRDPSTSMIVTFASIPSKYDGALFFCVYVFGLMKGKRDAVLRLTGKQMFPTFI